MPTGTDFSMELHLTLLRPKVNTKWSKVNLHSSQDKIKSSHTANIVKLTTVPWQINVLFVVYVLMFITNRGMSALGM